MDEWNIARFGIGAWCWTCISDIPYIVDWTYTGDIDKVCPCRSRLPDYHYRQYKSYSIYRLVLSLGSANAEHNFQPNHPLWKHLSDQVLGRLFGSRMYRQLQTVFQ